MDNDVMKTRGLEMVQQQIYVIFFKYCHDLMEKTYCSNIPLGLVEKKTF